MSEHWKSTPSYWCKFCKTYVRDTGLERKNHESTAKHQGNIQRSLRELHKGQERDQRDKQRAKDEVARLNGLVDGKGKAADGQTRPINAQSVMGGAVPAKATPEDRKRQAEQLLAMGVELPPELKQAITGVSDWSTVSQREVYDTPPTLADIKKEEDSKEDVKNAAMLSRGVHKRKADDEEDVRDEEAAPKRKIWGSSLKKYKCAEKEDNDLDALLSGIKKKSAVKTEEAEEVKKEEPADSETPLAAVPDVDAPAADLEVKKDPEPDLPTVVFKKRKGMKKS